MRSQPAKLLLALTAILSSGCGDDDAAILDGGLVDGAVAADGSESLDAGAVPDAFVRQIHYREGTNPESCDSRLGLSALESEAGHWQAVRVPVAEGFTIRSLGYRLTGPIEDQALCNPGVAHRVRVFFAPADEPTPVDPELAVEIRVDASDAVDLLDVAHSLTDPIVVPEGQVPHVMIEMVRDASNVLCTVGCTQEGYGAHTLWSNATAPDYTWASMADYDFPLETFVWVSEQP